MDESGLWFWGEKLNVFSLEEKCVGCLFGCFVSQESSFKRKFICTVVERITTIWINKKDNSYLQGYP